MYSVTASTCYGFREHMYHGENFEKIRNMMNLDVYSHIIMPLKFLISYIKLNIIIL